MLLIIGEVLNADQLTQVREDIDLLSWRDGAETAGRQARAVKQNLQADLSSRPGAALRQRLDSILQTHPVLSSAARPARFSPLLISRTPPGGGYGAHIDNAFMGAGQTRLRTDLSFTLFLNEPEDYEGGELVIDRPGENQTVKLKAGDLVLYPATYLHAVRPVTAGERLVCVGWIESLVRQASDREILFDMENLKVGLSERYEPDSPERLLAAKLLSNLLRRLSD